MKPSDKKAKPLTNKAGEVRRLTLDDIRQFRPAREVLPQEFLDNLAILKRTRGERGPQIAPKKQQITLRLDPQIIAHFKASGRGWQARINDVLQEIVQKGRVL